MKWLSAARRIPSHGVVLVLACLWIGVAGLRPSLAQTEAVTDNPLPVLIDRTSDSLVITDDVNAVAEGTTIGDRFAFQLLSQPTADVAATFTSSDPEQLQVMDFSRRSYVPADSYSVTFSASGAKGAHTVPWDTPVIMNLYGVPDAMAEGAQTYAIQFVLTSDDPVYNHLSIPDEPVTVYDPGVTNNPASLIGDPGSQAEYTIVLDAPPGFLALPASLGGSRDEHVTITVNDVAYLFTRANWDVPQTVPVTIPAAGTCLTLPETVTSDIDTNAYMDSAYGGIATPVPNITAPEMIIHAADTDCPPPTTETPSS